MPRRDTRLESVGAEFLVLGELLIRGIPAHKTYTNTPGYDVVAVDPEKNSVARISVKSRWNTDATGFIIKNFDCDFVVIVKLNRGTTKDTQNVRPPQFFVLPTRVVEELPSSNWGRIDFPRIPDFKGYADRWDLIRTFLSSSKGRPER